MPKVLKTWVNSPAKTLRRKVPVEVKVGVQEKADALVESVLKPRHVKPPPKDYDFNYIVDIYTKWYRHWFYFCAKYRSPGANALSPCFETKFARLEYVARNRFNLAFMRHTGEWIEVYPELSLDKCLTAIRDDPFFLP